MVPHIAEGGLDPVGDRLMNDIGDAHAAGLREPLEPRGHVHAVTEDVSIGEDDIPEVDPNAVMHLAVFGLGAVPFGH